jgi:hypothetical protein
MDFVVAIPSYDRADIIQNKTLNTLKLGSVPPEKIFIFVADAEDYNKYKKNVDKSLYNKLVIGKKGLVPQREFITNYFNEGQYIISLDDDIDKISIKKGLDKTDKQLDDVTDLPTMFERAYDRLIENKAFLWGVAPVHNSFFLYNKMTTDLKFICGAFFGYINRKSDDLKFKYGANKEDTERTLRYFKKDGTVVRFNNVAFKTNFYAKGGINSFEGGKQQRLINSKLNVEQLFEEFPEYGKIKVRSNGIYEFKLNTKPIVIKNEEITYSKYRNLFKVKAIQASILQMIRDKPSMIPKMDAPAKIKDPKAKATRGDKIGGIGRTQTFGFGNRRDKGWSEFSGNKQHPELLKLLIELGNAIVPVGTFYNAITFNIGVLAKKHKDGLNCGVSHIIGFGDFKGGKLRVYGSDDVTYKAYNLKNKVLSFDGSHFSHETEPFTGERITIIYYKQKYPTPIEGFTTVGV